MKPMYARLAGCVAATFLTLSPGCGLLNGGEPPVPPTPPPAAPSVVRLHPGANSVTVEWDAPDTVSGLSYKILRANSSTGSLDTLGSTEYTWYTDNNLAPDASYYYRLCTTRAGLDSDISTPFGPAVPHTYQIILNNGRTMTPRAEDVPIAFSLRSGTTGVTLSNTSNIPDNASMENPTTQTKWSLTSVTPPAVEDRTVYARFKDADGNTTVEFMATIRVDTAPLDGNPPWPPAGRATRSLQAR